MTKAIRIEDIKADESINVRKPSTNENIAALAKEIAESYSVPCKDGSLRKKIIDRFQKDQK